uniref:vacuolar protein sorting-associated protein 13B-like n=1 Tax=Ciona intestinalis TaxID=7719 RepID=UPI000180C8B6|nr:vacuolar protein sorting-associated protein 13B-like [Ciona intestinalis]|eukprot:XP_026690885.1 vacuolar protein sorting-associated protein 13B-like [Ciona intestinalis]
MSMLRLESYLSPFLLSYLSKYVKDIEAKNFQLSLWGGDAVLHNLQFKLDALDNELGAAPFSFVSCQAQEMRLHVPWSKLASEPVVATLNTVECVIKLNCHKTLKKEVVSTKDDKSNPPPVQASYIEGLLRKIKNNFSIVVNNLILKYIEDDIVLSVNIQTASYNGVNEQWKPAFVELTEKSPVLRHVCELKDMTVCLDRRGVSGRVESFEEPLLFRSNLVIRKHTTFPKHISRRPSAIKFNLMMDRYELNISEVQLPAVLHLLQLCLHLYYGRIEVSHTIEETTVEAQNESQEGWASWAWSYVPPILSYDELEKNEVRNPVLTFAFYIKHIWIKFKPSRSGSSKQFHRSQSTRSRPLLEMEAQGLSLEIVSRGLDFFSCLTTLAFGSISYLGGVPDTVNGVNISNHACNEKILIASGGGSLVGFAADSLFDFRSPENNDTPSHYILTKQEFDSKQSACRTSDVFYSEYLYIAEDGRHADAMEEVEFNDFLREVNLKDVEQWENVQERSWKKIIVGGERSELFLSSYTLLCADVLTSWARNHTHKEYPLRAKEIIVQPQSLKQGNLIFFVPTRMSTFEIRNTSITLPVLHTHCRNYSPKRFHRVDLYRKGSYTQLHPHNDETNAKLPCLITNIQDARFTMDQPMYARHLAAYLSAYRSPPSRLLEKCNTHYTAVVSNINSYIWMSDPKPNKMSTLPSSTLPVIQVDDVVMESHSLQGQEFWEERSTMLCGQTKFTLHSFSILGTPFQLEMLSHTLDSWMQYVKPVSNVDQVLDVSFMQSTFEENTVGNLHFVVQNVIAEVNSSFSSHSICGALKSIDLYWNANNQVIPIIQCTHHLNSNHLTNTFSNSTPPKLDLQRRQHEKRSLVWNEDSHWLSFYIRSPTASNTYGVAVVHMHSTVVNIDPFILNIVSHFPGIPLQHLLPVTTEANLQEEKESTTSLSPNFKYAIQLQNKGVHILLHKNSIPIDPHSYLTLSLTDAIRLKMMDSDTCSGITMVCFPEITAFTSGHKRLKVTPDLLKKGVPVNKFTEFGTLNIGLENASVYTVLTHNTDQHIHYIAQPCAATCTVVITPPKSTSSKTSAAIHLDVEPIKLKISQPQAELLVAILNQFLTCINDVKKNCPSPQLEQKVTMEKVQSQTPIESVKSANPKPGNAESKSNLSVTESSSVSDKLPFTLWLQCTLPKFSATIYHKGKVMTKIELQVEDVSLSLDVQSVYLKLMSSFSTCSVHHYTRTAGAWSNSEWKGVTLSPMFSTLPSFLQVCETPKFNALSHNSDSATKHGKFFDITFTQALTSDYHQHLREEEDCIDAANSSVINSEAKSVRKCVSEVICTVQPFDLMLNPSIIEDLFNTFSPLLGIIAITSQQNGSSSTKLASHFNIPAFYFTVGGIRLIIPLQFCENLPPCRDSALMACFNHLQINPRPQNPLTRLVLAPNIYRKANAAGLLQCTGSALEDKQFEFTFQDISIGTTKFSEVVAYLNNPTPSDNPALQWNTAGKIPKVEEPTFHPIIEQFDMHATIAPAIWHRTATRETIVCAPSFEANLITDVVIHLTAMQIGTVLDIGKECSENLENVLTSYHSVTSQSPEELATLNEDSGFSVCESSHASEKPVKAANVSLMGDGLLTSCKVKLMCYEFVENTADEKLVKPVFLLEIFQPSFVCQVSKQSQKIEMQFHDAEVKASDGKPVQQSLIHSDGNYASPLLQTLSGKCDKRTGIPPSLFTATVPHFLTSKANINVAMERPMKFHLDENVVNAINSTLCLMGKMGPKNKARETATVQPSNLAKLFSSASFQSDQIVLEVDFSTYAVRGSLSSLKSNLQLKNNSIGFNVDVHNLAVRHRLDNKDFTPFLLPVSIQVSSQTNPIKKASISPIKLRVNTTPIHIMCDSSIIDCINPVKDCILKWQSFLTSNSNDKPLQKSGPHLMSNPLYSTNSDDLRMGTYTYITSDDHEPQPNQIVFSSKAPQCSMTWSYSQPHTIKSVHITPLPFKVPQNSDEENIYNIKCILESYDDGNSVYVKQKDFLLSETDHVEFNLFSDETPFHEIACATKWRVIVFNENEVKISPMSLAASMQVESVFSSNLISSMSVHVNIKQVLFTFLCHKNQNKIECMQMKADDIVSEIKQWTHVDPTSLSAFCDLKLFAQVIDHRNITWLPILQSCTLHLLYKNLQELNQVKVECKDKLELHVSQRVLHSLQYLLTVCGTGSMSSSHQDFPGILLKNNTESFLLIGQGMTDECLRMAPKTETSYSWRSHKCSPMLHVSIEGFGNSNWSDTFSPYPPNGHHLMMVGDENGVVISTEMNTSWQAKVTFNGQIRFINRMSFDLNLSVEMQDKTVTANIPTGRAADYLVSPSGIASVLISLSSDIKDLSPKVLLSDLMMKNTEPKIVKLFDFDGTPKYVQIHHYKHDLTNTFVLLPVFVICSHLPKPVILHVESRSEQKTVTYILPGCGQEKQLTDLTPDLTHHLTIQMNENESPFDATIPIHCSLRNTMPETGDFNLEKEDLTSTYPMYVKQNNQTDENWNHSDGKIQANLSLNCKSLLVELTPWCLIHNQTNLVFCITSSDGSVSIIQPGQIEVPDHFTGLFQLRTSTSSSSEWLTLEKDEENDHPSRSGMLSSTRIAYNGSLSILLRKKSTIFDVLIKSSIQHGIRLLTITPKWWFVNASQDHELLKVSGCTNYHEKYLMRRRKLLDASAESPIPLLKWRMDVESSSYSDSTSSEETGVKDDSVDVKDNEVTVITSSVDTTSSFMCIGTDINVGTLRACFVDRTLCVFTKDLVGAVSVENQFRRRLINLHETGEKKMAEKLFLTKFEHDDMIYLILNDVKGEKYYLHNHTSSTLCLREIADVDTHQTTVEVKPTETVAYESFMDAELFPRCLRNYRSIKMQLAKEGVNQWTEILVSGKAANTEIDIPGIGMVKLTTVVQNAKIRLHFGEIPIAENQIPLTKQYSFSAKIPEMKVVFLDDLINHIYSIDMVQAFLDEVHVIMTKDTSSKNWIAKLSLSNIQVDNHAYPETDFPVFISSLPTDADIPFQLMLTCSDSFQILSIDLKLLPLEVRSESAFAQALSSLLQSYMESAKGVDVNVAVDPMFPNAVQHEAKIISQPLRLQSISIQQAMLILSFRAAVKLYVSIDRGVLSFSKFSCRDVDTTVAELTQELMRHYFAETVFGAGWVIGSLDLLGNPATALRSYAKGVSDFLLMPYEGLMMGPTAFVGGFTRGLSSLLRHLSSGTLRSVTNIASSISRNLSREQKLQQRYFKLPGETSEILLSSAAGDQDTNSSSSGLVSGISKALVGVVTKPLGGAAGMVSRAGETIIQKVGLEEQKTQRQGSSSHTISSYRNSASKFSLKVIQDNVSVDMLFLLDCQILSTNEAGFECTLVISPSNLYIIRSADDEIESVLPIKDIDLRISETSENHVLSIHQAESTINDTDAPYTEKVADYLGVNKHSNNDGPIEPHSEVKYTACVVNNATANLFLSLFHLLKQKPNKFSW